MDAGGEDPVIFDLQVYIYTRLHWLYAERFDAVPLTEAAALSAYWSGRG